MIANPPKIELLPEHLIDQIKAGEVIERPGNLIKEIIENAVDAGASKIELILKNNGLDLISLKDNGHGMRFEDIPLAFSRHATSKISRFEDLYQLHSFGFRGEALASIAAISKLQCISFTQSASEGAELRIEGGHTIFHGKRQKSGANTGTELVIQDLFYNTPARLKFIQSQQAEKQFIKKIIFAFVLSNPQIEFHFKIDEDEKEIIPAAENLKTRIFQLAPKSKDLVLHSEKFYENNEVEVFLIPGNIKLPVKWQNLFINNRYILDKQLHRVLANALMSAFGHDEFHYIVFFRLPPDSIDVNVHPNKTIVKCLETSKMISLLTSTVKELAHQNKPQIAETQARMPQEPLQLSMQENRPLTLSQERHEYNMDGLFSPHLLHLEKTPNLIWIGSYFLKERDGYWLAVASTKLLDAYVKEKLKSPAPQIPLLVSEPYSAKATKNERINILKNAGFEIEYLAADTLVLRSIPDWINGFPLKEIVICLLEGKSMTEVSTLPQDWSLSSWDEMIDFFPTDFLRERKIVLDLKRILQDQFK